MQAQYESNIEQTYNADEWLDSDEGAGTSSSKRDRKESKRVRQDNRKLERKMKRGNFDE